jgi:hypothetical protein
VADVPSGLSLTAQQEIKKEKSWLPATDITDETKGNT